MTSLLSVLLILCSPSGHEDEDLAHQIAALRSNDPDSRVSAAQAIGRMGERGKDAIPALIAALTDYRTNTQGTPVAPTCSKALAQIGEVAIPAVLEALDSENIRTFTGGAAAVRDYDPPPPEALPRLVRELSTKDEQRLFVAIRVIASYGADAAAAVPGLIAALGHENFHVQYSACDTLGAIGPAAAPAVPKLIALTDNGVTSVRGRAAMCLGLIGVVPDHDIVGALLRSTDDRFATVRDRALAGLGQLGPAAAEALPEIRKKVADRRYRNRVPAALALWRVSGSPDASVEVLVGLFENNSLRFDAIHALGEMGPAASAAVPQLSKRFESEDPDERLEVAQSLGLIATPEALALLKEAAQTDKDPDVRAVALKHLKTSPGD